MSSEEDDLVRCARCGRLIDDDNDEVALEVYTADERVDPNDPELLVASYCATCTRQIEREHERHDRQLDAFREQLDHVDENGRSRWTRIVYVIELDKAACADKRSPCEGTRCGRIPIYVGETHRALRVQ